MAEKLVKNLRTWCPWPRVLQLRLSNLRRGLAGPCTPLHFALRPAFKIFLGEKGLFRPLLEKKKNALGRKSLGPVNFPPAKF